MRGKIDAKPNLNLTPEARLTAYWAKKKQERLEQEAEQEKKHEEAKNRPSIPSQEKFHRGILRGLRNISDTP